MTSFLAILETYSNAQVIAILGSIGTIFGSAWALVERVRSGRKNEMLAIISSLQEHIKVKDQIIQAHGVEHQEYLKYREDHHKTVQEDNLKMLTLTAENAELKARSDLTPVLTSLEKVIRALDHLTARIEHLLPGRSEKDSPQPTTRL